MATSGTGSNAALAGAAGCEPFAAGVGCGRASVLGVGAGVGPGVGSVIDGAWLGGAGSFGVGAGGSAAGGATGGSLGASGACGGSDTV